jgi:hypothetical protein
MWVVADLDDDYIRNMEDVLEVYERPYDPQQPVVCLDEKPITLHADVRPGSPAAPGREARQDNEYKRCGTANVFCAVEPKAGRHFTFATPDRSGFEFAQVAVSLALAYPDAKCNGPRSFPASFPRYSPVRSSHSSLTVKAGGRGGRDRILRCIGRRGYPASKIQ